MITLISSKNLGVYRNMRHTVTPSEIISTLSRSPSTQKTSQFKMENVHGVSVIFKSYLLASWSHFIKKFCIIYPMSILNLNSWWNWFCAFSENGKVKIRSEIKPPLLDHITQIALFALFSTCSPGFWHETTN